MKEEGRAFPAAVLAVPVQREAARRRLCADLVPPARSDLDSGKGKVTLKFEREDKSLSATGRRALTRAAAGCGNVGLLC